MSEAMQRRLDMLLNISVAGLKDVDKATQTIKRHGSEAKAVALGLTEIEGAAENAGKNFEAFRSAAGRAGAALVKYNDIQERLKTQQAELSNLAQARSKIMIDSEKKSADAVRYLQDSFEDLKSVYARAEKAAGTTFKPLEDEANNAQVSMRQLKESLAEIEDSYRKMVRSAKQPRDPSGQFAKEPTEGGAVVNTEALETEKRLLVERADIIRDTIERAEQLTRAQQNYVKVQQEVAQVDEQLNRNTEQTRASQEAVEVLTQKKTALINKLHKEGEVLNKLSGQSLVSVNRETGEASVRTKELDGVLRNLDKTTKGLNTAMEDKAKKAERAAKASERVGRSAKQTTNALEEQNQEWNVMRQRISKNDEALWGLRRSLGALRNQILVVLFATRWLRNAMSSARDTIIEVDQGMIGLRRTAISMGQDFKHLEGITREFEKRGLQNADEAAMALRNILQTGMGVEEATNLLYVFTDAAAFNARSQRDLTDSVIRASEAFRDQRAQGLQAIGITQRMTDMVRMHANATGQQTAEVMGLERHMAIYNAIMQESAKFTGNANDLLHTFEGNLISLEGASKSTSEAFGDLLRPVFKEFTRTMIESHQASTKFFRDLNEAHKIDIDRWAARVAKFIKELTSVMGMAGGGILKLIIQYGDFLVILGQVLIAKSILNKRMIKHAERMLEMQKTTKGYSIAVEQNTTILGKNYNALVATNTATGEKVYGMQALQIAYQKNRVAVLREKTALKGTIGVRAINIKLLNQARASYIAKGMTVDQATAAVKANKSAIIASTGAMVAQRKAILTLIPGFVALKRTIIAAGGAARVAMVAFTRLLVMMGKFALIFLAISAITHLISRLTGAAERANELTMANERLNRSYDELAAGVDRTSRRFAAVQERADLFGVDIHALQRSQDIVKQHYDRLLELQNQFIQSTDKNRREELQKSIDHYTNRMREEQDILESMSQKKLETFQEYESFVLDIQEKSQEAQTNLMSHHGVQQLYEARRVNRQFIHLLEDRAKAIEHITSVSETARLQFEQWANRVRVENQRQTNEEQKKLAEDLSKAIIDTDRRLALDRISLEEESVNNIRQQFAIRRAILNDENEETIQAYEERLEGLRAVARAERAVIEDRIQSTSIAMQGQIKVINKETERLAKELGDWDEKVASRRTFVKPFEEFSTLFDQLNQKLVDAEGPTQFQNVLMEMNQAVKDFQNEVGPGSNLGKTLEKAFTPQIEELAEHTRNWVSRMEESAGASELLLRNVRPLLDNIDGLREGTMNLSREMGENTAWLEESISLYENEIRVLREAQHQALENLSVEERLAVSAFTLNDIYERTQKSIEALSRSEERRARFQSGEDQQRILRLEENMNSALLQRGELLSDVQIAEFEIGQTRKAANQERLEEITALRQQAAINKENLDQLKYERELRKGLLDERHLRDLDERISLLSEEHEFMTNYIEAVVELQKQQERVQTQEEKLQLSRAHLTHVTEKLNEAQQRANELSQQRQETLAIELRLKEVELLTQELTARNRLLPVMGHILSARREGLNAMQMQMQEQRDEIEMLGRQRDMVGEQIKILDSYIQSNKDLTGQERLQADMRLEQLRQQYGWMQQLVGANEEYARVLEKQLDIQRRQDLTRSITEHLQPTIDMYHSFADSMREIDNQILLDRHKFQLEYMDQLKHGEINHAQHTHIMLAQQQYLTAREQHLRQQRLASLVRDVGREISLYAARMAAQSGNFVAAIGLLAGGAGIIAASHSIASRIERQSTMAFQQAEVEFQRAQRQMQDMDQGVSGDDSRSRKFGGTIRADNLVVNISPTMIVEGEQIFIGSGSATEFSREVAEMMMESIQQSIDDRRIDLSNVPRGN